MSDLFHDIYGQPEVRSFLRRVTEQKRVSHAYLFAGPLGSNKLRAAKLFAQAIVCSCGGCGNCSECKKARLGTHPDIVYFEPEGAQGYLVEQMRDLMAQADLTPVLGKKKVFIISAADALDAHAANAFLKTLEEPPEPLVLILLARITDMVLPTLVSRCQVVPFRYIPTHLVAEILAQETGCELSQAAIALAASDGSIAQAAHFLKDASLQDLRLKTLSMLAGITQADDADILGYGKDLVLAAKAPLDRIIKEYERSLEEQADYLTPALKKRAEKRHERRLSAESTRHLNTIISLAESYLRDCVVTKAGAVNLLINTDWQAQIGRQALACSYKQLYDAILACTAAKKAITYNVSPETSLDVMLFEIREALIHA